MREGRCELPLDEGQSVARRKWLRLGPGLAVALLLSAVVYVSEMGFRLPWQSGNHPPPILERQLIHARGGKGRLAPVPEVKSLLERAEAIGLSAEQVKSLKKLQAEWERNTARSRAELEEQSMQFRKFMEAAQKGGRVSVSQIQEQAQPVSTLSAELLSQRLQYWQRAMKILTHDQRKKVTSELTAESRRTQR